MKIRILPNEESSPAIERCGKYKAVAIEPVEAAGFTDPGRVRENNEDNFALFPDMGLYIVSDGMGGLNAGEKASGLIVSELPQILQEKFSREKKFSHGEVASIFDSAIVKLSRRINSFTAENRGAGATIVACLLYEDRAFIAHMGDSRAYLLNNSNIERLTEDHSFVGSLLQAGVITRSQAESHPARHVIMRYVGMSESIGPDIVVVKISPGEQILLCTDGLTNMLTDGEIEKIILDKKGAGEVCRALVSAANDAGGRDNITALLLRF